MLLLKYLLPHRHSWQYKLGDYRVCHALVIAYLVACLSVLIYAMGLTLIKVNTMSLTIALCIALSVSIAIASLVSYLEGTGENLLAAGVLAAAMIVGWSFIIYMSLRDAA